jgi:hypothetical protein
MSAIPPLLVEMLPPHRLLMYAFHRWAEAQTAWPTRRQCRDALIAIAQDLRVNP